MKQTSAVLALGTALALTVAFDSSALASQLPDVFSAAKKKGTVVAQPAPVARRWRGADPSFDENGRPYKPPEYLAGCALDLGYGRWVSCSTSM